MKNNVQTSSSKDQRSINTFCARLTPTRLLVGVLSMTLFLLSLIGAIAVVTSTHTIAAGATVATNSVTKHTAVPTDTSTPTATPSPTSSPTPTKPTPTPTPTTTMTPTPTSLPSPTATPKPSPTQASTPTPTPIPTSAGSTNPSPSPTGTTNTALATPNATGTVALTTPAQSSSQDQTPTSSSTSNTILSALQDQQNGTFPFITLEIGIPSTIAATGCFFTGWWLLRKRLLPVKKVKLPPSGANPWSRVRPGNPQWGMYSNGSTQPVGNYDQLSNGLASWSQDNNVPTGISFNSNIVPPNNNIVTTALPNYQEGTPDLNNPYLKQVIKQYSDKSRAARLHQLSNTGDTQASQPQDDDALLQ